MTRLPIVVDVAERDAGQPVDADMDVLDRFLAAGNVEVAAARRAAADEDGVEIFGEQRLQAVDALGADEFDAEIEDVIALLVDDAFRQTEFRNLRAHHAAGFRILVEHDAFVAHRGQVPRHRERGWAAAHERDALAVLDLGRLRQAVLMSSLKSAATRFKRQIATGSFSTRPRRQAGSHGRSQVRPKIPGKTLESQLIM